jgi:hypothetical protein
MNIFTLTEPKNKLFPHTMSQRGNHFPLTGSSKSSFNVTQNWQKINCFRILTTGREIQNMSCVEYEDGGTMQFRFFNIVVNGESHQFKSGNLVLQRRNGTAFYGWTFHFMAKGTTFSG